MCCFSRAVSHVGSTQIFARSLEGNRQAIVYSMTIAIDEELAMVLPVPIAPIAERGSGREDAIDFIDLSKYRTFFDDLEKCFPPPPRASGPFAPMAAAPRQRAQLAVHDVGDYVASYVPTAGDFDRLDPRFRLPSLVSLHSAYVDYGFAVFQLRPHDKSAGAKSKEQTIQPMAFTFPSRRPRSLFFPTFHVHDGRTAPATAHFDHLLTLQSDDAILVETLKWRRSEYAVGKHVKTSKMATAGGTTIVRDDAHAHRAPVLGTWPNEDTWLDPPACSSIDKLSGQGDRFAFTIDASAAHSRMNDEQALRRKQTARTRIDALHDALLAGLTALTTAKAAEWDLAIPRPPTFWERVRGDEIPRLWLSGRKAFSFVMGPGPSVLEPGTPGPFEIEIAAETDRVPRQSVRFFFAKVPSETTIEAIEIALAEVLDRACG